MIDQATWPTEAEAAAQIGVSVRTLQRYGEQGKIEIRSRPRDGKKPENVCNPRDLERLMPSAHVMPEDEPNGNGHHVVKRVNGTGPDAFFSFISTITSMIATTRRDDVIAPPTPRLWLSIDEAAEVSGLSRGYLLGQIDTGRIVAAKAGPRGAWRIQRASLEAFAG